MAEDKPKNETALAALSPQELTIRHALVKRGLQSISENENTDMYSWLANIPPGSTLLSLSFQDGSELPSDDRDMSLWSKRSSEMASDEMLRALMEERCTGLINLNLLEKDLHTVTGCYRGYIEVEGTHPFERSGNLVGANEKEILMCAVGILLRRLLVVHGSIRIYCDGDTLLRFLSDDLKSVETLVEQINSTLDMTVVKIRKPDGTIAKRQSGLFLDLTEYRRV
jgi:hypothetical protein